MQALRAFYRARRYSPSTIVVWPKTNGREPPWGVGTPRQGYSKVPPPGYPPGSPGGIALSQMGARLEWPRIRVHRTTPEGTPEVHAHALST